MGKWSCLCDISQPSFLPEEPLQSAEVPFLLNQRPEQLPQSTSQVLINVQAFASKRSPIYRSILSHLGVVDPLRPSGEADLLLPHPNLDLRLRRVNIESVLVVKFLLIHFLIQPPRALSQYQIFGDLVCTLMGRRSAPRSSRESGQRLIIHQLWVGGWVGRGGGGEAPDLCTSNTIIAQRLRVQPDSLIAFHTAASHPGAELD